MLPFMLTTPSSHLEPLGFFFCTTDCKNVKLPWKLVLKLFSNFTFVLLGKSLLLKTYHCVLKVHTSTHNVIPSFEPNFGNLFPMLL